MSDQPETAPTPLTMRQKILKLMCGVPFERVVTLLVEDYRGMFQAPLENVLPEGGADVIFNGLEKSMRETQTKIEGPIIALCEEQLSEADVNALLRLMETPLYKKFTVICAAVERIKRRWQDDVNAMTNAEIKRVLEPKLEEHGWTKAQDAAAPAPTQGDASAPSTPATFTPPGAA